MFTQKELEKMKPELEKQINEDGEYIIPIQWSVYSTITVKNAKNLADALQKAYNKLEDIPLPTDNEYIDGSFEIAVNDVEDAVNGLNYRSIGDYEIDASEE